VIIGLRADEIATNMLKVTGSIRPSARAGTSAQVQEASPETGGMPASAAPYLLAALGGAANVVQVEAFGPRISFLLKNVEAIEAETLRTNGFRGHADLGGGRVQVIADDDLNLLAETLKESL
jgi:phosphotransferase system IIB component